MTNNGETLLASADAARLLGVTPATVRLMQRRGELPGTLMTAGGMHLYRRVDVERLAAKRAALRASGGRS